MADCESATASTKSRNHNGDVIADGNSSRHGSTDVNGRDDATTVGSSSDASLM